MRIPARHVATLLGAAIVLGVALVAVFAPLLAPHDPFAQNLNARLVVPLWMEGGTETNPFGTDQLGRDVFSRVIVEKVEPNLGQGRATILCEYPVAEAALARPKPGDPRVAERFELYACGVELANAFGELTDPAEQRRRFVAEMDDKQRIYGERYPIDEDFLSALEIMPEASGCALGFDRLAMLATGATRVDQVMWVPVAG